MGRLKGQLLYGSMYSGLLHAIENYPFNGLIIISDSTTVKRLLNNNHKWAEYADMAKQYASSNDNIAKYYLEDKIICLICE